MERLQRERQAEEEKKTAKPAVHRDDSLYYVPSAATLPKLETKKKFDESSSSSEDEDVEPEPLPQKPLNGYQKVSLFRI